MVTVNTQGVATGFKPVAEPDWYDAVLTGCKSVDSAGKKGEAGATLEFTIEDPREDGHKCWRFYSLSAKALPYIKGAAVELGADPTVLEGPWDTDDLFPPLYGTKCRILVRHRDYEGETQDDVKAVRSRDSVAATGKAKKGGSW